MNEIETLQFLDVVGVKQLSVGAWQPHQPVLYVLDEETRLPRGDKGKLVTPDKVASIARIDDPIAIEWYEASSINPTRTQGALRSDRGQIDYYAINPVTRTPVLVGTSTPVRTNAPFLVEKSKLFEATDLIFPKSSR